MSLESPTFRMISQIAPAVTIALLLALPLLLPNQAAISATAELRQEHLQQVMEAVPYSIGPWIGIDEEVPQAAIEMLHSTAILSRRYDRLPRGPMVSVLMVHCTDARDIVGHYPPICYPNSGWTPDKYNPRGIPFEVRVDALDLVIPVTEFQYSHVVDHGRMTTIRIFDFFILPDGTLTREQDDIHKQSERLAVSLQGAAQVQVITISDVPREEALAQAGDLLGGMKELFSEFGVVGAPTDG